MIPQVFAGGTLQEIYADIVHAVRFNGEHVEVRPGVETRELRYATVYLESPYNAMPTNQGRKLNTRIGIIESLGLLSGVDVTDLLVAEQPRFRQYLNDGMLRGAYGPRLATQFKICEALLRDEPGSRQAVASIWIPGKDPYYGNTISKDPPCTVNVQFLIRDGALESVWTMRSNDVWFGLAYDAYQFAQAHIAMTSALQEQLGVVEGPLVIRQSSLHLYERDVVATEELTEPGMPSPEPEHVRGTSWGDVQSKALLKVIEMRETR